MGSSPTQPKNFVRLRKPAEPLWSHSAGGGAHSIDQVHTAVHCSLLLFFWVTLADLTFLTAIWCTSRYFMTLLAGSESYHYWKGRRREAVATRPETKFSVFEREKIMLAIGDRIRFRKNVKHRGQKFLDNDVRTVVSIDQIKIILNKG